MRIDRFDLLAYGSFTDKSLDLSAGDKGFHLIYGDNEAGKSTSLRALIAWLFGFPARTNDNFLHDNPQLRIGGKLKLSNGKELDYVRRKGTKGTLLDPETSDEINDAKLLPFIPGDVDEALFTRLYGIDYQRLISGGQELLQQSGDLGQALFSAAAGTTSLRTILSNLQNSADEYFKPRATTKIVNQHISGFKEAKKASKEASLPVAEWKSLQRNLKQTLKEITEIEDEITELSKTKSRLERLNRVKGTLAEHHNVQQKLAEVSDVIMLPEDFDQSRKEAVNNLQANSERKEKAKNKLSSLKKEAESLKVSEELLANEEEIMEIYRELGAVEKAIADLPQQDGKRRQLRNESEKLLRSVRQDVGLDDAERLRPLLNNKKWISGLVNKHDLLKQKKSEIKVALQEFETRMDTIDQELSAMPRLSLDLSELKAEIAAARKAGDLTKRMADAQKKADEAQAASADEFSRLGRFSGKPEDLSTIAMPVDGTLDIYEKKLEELTGTIKDLRRKEKEFGEEKRKAEQNLESLLAKGEVPAAEDLQELRTSRNTGWHLIKSKYIEQQDVEEEIYRFTPAGDLAGLYEQKIEAADNLSDQMRLAADQVVKRAELEAKLKNLTSEQAGINQEIELAVQALTAEENSWQKVWQPLGIEAGKPGEMKQWLLRAESFIANLRTLKNLHDEVSTLRDEYNKFKETMARQICKFDGTKSFDDISLEAMINLCEQRVEQEEALQAQKKQLKSELDQITIKVKKKEEELEQVQGEEIAWFSEWSQAIEGLDVKPDRHPQYAAERFEKLITFFENYDRSEDLRKRIYGMEKVVSEFESTVFDFADSINFDRNGKAAKIIAAELHRCLNQSREAKARLKELESQIRDLTEEIKDAEINIKNAEELLTILRGQAKVASNDQLENAAERSTKKRALQRELDALEQELARSGDGLSLQALQEEAAEKDIDALDNEISNISAKLEELQSSRDQLRDQRQIIQNEINAKDGSAAAAKASAEAEEHLASIVSGVENYLRFQIAALILEKQIEDYRKNNQAPVLSRAGQLFSKLTLGFFANLRDEIDENGKPVLLGVRPGNYEVAVDGMSDGTRDQLYLSLRLATLEQHLMKREPMPFIVDDILIGFDDDRTKACLGVLAELSKFTQVILFTHHKKVIELSKDVRAEAGIYTHELN